MTPHDNEEFFRRASAFLSFADDPLDSPFCLNSGALSRAIVLERLHDAEDYLLEAGLTASRLHETAKASLYGAFAALINIRRRSLYRDFVAPLPVRRCRAIRTAQIDGMAADLVAAVRGWRRDWPDFVPVGRR